MTGHQILPLELQLPALLLLAIFLAWVVSLIRSHRLSVRESLLWLLSTGAALLVTAFPDLLVWSAHAFGFQVPANALFAGGFVYLALNVLSVTVAVSANSARVRRLTQECALLRAEIEALRGSPRSPPAERSGG